PELDQVIEQRHLALFELVFVRIVGHDGFGASGAAGSAFVSGSALVSGAASINGGLGGSASGLVSSGAVSDCLSSPCGSMVFDISSSKLKRVAASRSRLTSSSSASRTMSSRLFWNSRAIERALRTQNATFFITRGKSLGPITTKATTAMSASSDQAKSNMSVLSAASQLFGGRFSLGFGFGRLLGIVGRRPGAFHRQIGELAGLAQRQFGPWSNQAGSAQLFDARQIGGTGETEMQQERVGRAPGHRPADGLAATLGPDPADLHQQIERARRHHDAANILDLGARYRLVIRDDSQCLHRRARQLARNL